MKKFRPPPEFWLIAMIALGVSGHFREVGAIVLLYLFLRHKRPEMAPDLLMIVSGFWGVAIVEAIWNANRVALWEQLIVAGSATMLFHTQNRGWARFLRIYCITSASLFLLLVIMGKRSNAQQFYIARGVLHIVGAWLITRWLRRQKLDTNRERILSGPDNTSNIP